MNWRRSIRQYGTDQRDAAALAEGVSRLIQKFPDGPSGSMKRRIEIDPKRGVPALIAAIDERPIAELSGRPASGADHRIEPAERLISSFERLFCGIRVGQIGPKGFEMKAIDGTSRAGIW
jgi:hypothetical protein